MTVRDLMKKMKEEYTLSEFREEWKCVVNAAKDTYTQTIRKAKYKTKSDSIGEVVAYSDLNSALEEVRERILNFKGDWEISFSISVCPKRDFLPSVMSLHLE